MISQCRSMELPWITPPSSSSRSAWRAWTTAPRSAPDPGANERRTESPTPSRRKICAGPRVSVPEPFARSDAPPPRTCTRTATHLLVRDVNLQPFWHLEVEFLDPVRRLHQLELDKLRLETTRSEWLSAVGSGIGRKCAPRRDTHLELRGVPRRLGRAAAHNRSKRAQCQYSLVRAIAWRCVAAMVLTAP